MTKRATTMMIIVLLLGLAACSYRTARDPDALVVALAADPAILNPILSSDAYANEVENRVYEPLADRDNATLAFRPRLAERWEVSPDHLTYTFYLRRGVRWHDGQPFTAADVVFTFERIRDPQVDAAPLRNFYRDVKRIERLDDFTVRFTYVHPYFLAFEILAEMPIIPRHVFASGGDFNDHPANRQPIGTGPYRLTSWDTGRKIVLTRFADYWGTLPAINAIVFKVIPDTTVSFQLLKKGDLDLAEMRAVQWSRQTSSTAFNTHFAKLHYYSPNFSYIGWNLKRPFFTDRRVRRAMTMLIDRQAIIEKLLFGQGEVVSGPFYRFGSDYDTSIKPWDFDPHAAAQLLDEAGWIDHDGDGIRDRDGIPFHFSLLMPAGSKIYRSMGLMLRRELAQVGIEMELRNLEWAAMLKLVNDGDFDALVLAWALPLEPDLYQIFHSSQIDKGSNRIGFANSEADRIIETLRREFDPGRRALLSHQLHRLLHEEEPYTFLFTNPALVAVARRFTNVKEYRVGVDPLEWRVATDALPMMEW